MLGPPPKKTGTTGHAEAAEVIYDPNEISFEDILEVFWNRHNPTQLNRQGNDVGTQYRGGIYYTSEGQRVAAEASKAKCVAWRYHIVHSRCCRTGGLCVHVYITRNTASVDRIGSG
jgi:methionine-S-sulfoxide reductase